RSKGGWHRGRLLGLRGLGDRFLQCWFLDRGLHLRFCRNVRGRTREGRRNLHGLCAGDVADQDDGRAKDEVPGELHRTGSAVRLSASIMVRALRQISSPTATNSALTRASCSTSPRLPAKATQGIVKISVH